jgi:hypothetical protein
VHPPEAPLSPQPVARLTQRECLLPGSGTSSVLDDIVGSFGARADVHPIGMTRSESSRSTLALWDEGPKISQRQVEPPDL